MDKVPPHCRFPRVTGTVPGRSIAVAAAALMSWVALALLQPLGFDTGEKSNAIAQRVTGMFHGGGGDDYQDASLVVLFRDEDLIRDSGSAEGRQRVRAWPIPFIEHGLILDAILAGRPRAVFVDIMFLENRQGDDSMSDMLDMVAEAQDRIQGAIGRRVPVVFGHPADPTRLHPELLRRAEQRNGIELATAGWRGNGASYALAATTETPWPTAAYALYRHACEQTGFVGECPPQGVTDADFAAPLAIRWGAGLPSHRQLFHEPEPDDPRDQRCRVVDTGFAARAMEAVRLLIFPGRQPCPFTLTLGPRQLGAPDAQRILQDRVVFYGAEVSASPDLHPTPIHGLMPGVYLHAMAFDNLIRWGTDYYQAPRLLGEVNVLNGAIVFTIALLADAISRRQRFARWRGNCPRISSREGLHAAGLGFGLILAVFLIGLALNLWALPDWLGILAVLMAAEKYLGWQWGGRYAVFVLAVLGLVAGRWFVGWQDLDGWQAAAAVTLAPLLCVGAVALARWCIAMLGPRIASGSGVSRWWNGLKLPEPDSQEGCERCPYNQPTLQS